jgi:hypothetical protein
VAPIIKDDRMTMQWTAMKVLITACVVAATGCGRDEPAAPVTQPAATATAPATLPVAAAASVLSIDGKPVAFPTSALRLTRRDDGVALLLYTPDTALAEDATANTVLFAATLDATPVSDLAGETLHLASAPTDTDADTANCLALDGGATQLLTSDVDVTFTAAGDGWMTLGVHGTFSKLDAKGVQRPVKVDGTLWARVELSE